MALNKVLNRHSGRFANLSDLSKQLDIPLNDLKALLEPHHEGDHEGDDEPAGECTPLLIALPN